MGEFRLPTFEEYRDFLIERGLADCRELLPKQKGNMVAFYRGAIDEFEFCRTIKDIMEMEQRFRELQALGRWQFLATGPSPKELDLYWYLSGRENQVEFLFERLKLLYCQAGDLTSARAGIDFYEWLFGRVPFDNI